VLFGTGGDITRPDGINLNVKCHVHFETIPLIDGDAEVCAVKRGASGQMRPFGNAAAIVDKTPPSLWL
jgi:hypothetical protein